MRRSIATVVAAVILGSITAGGVAAGSQEPALEDTFPVAPGLVRELRSWTTGAGAQRVNVLRFHLDDERVAMRPELALGQVAGREPVHHTVRRLGEDAVAAVNGGFWFDAPSGDPDGAVIQDGRYLSEPATNGAGPRAAFALFGDGTWEVGRPDHHGAVWFPSGKAAPLTGINRAVPSHGIVALNSGYAPTSDAPPDAMEVVFDVELRPNTLDQYEVVQVRPAGGPLPDGKTVLVGRDGWADEIAALEPGERVTFDFRFTEPWDGAVHALAAGPLLVQDGERVPPDEWETEGFKHEVHNDRAHPRTIVGFTADGEMLLVTVDGRQRTSPGITSQEAAELMVQLGAVDALMMDGGGSSTMSVDGRIANRPCCDEPGYRWVATSLVVRSNVDTPDVARLAGDDRFGTAASVARHGWPDGAPHAFLANGTSFPDGLAGGPLAAARRSPLLLTAQGSLPAATRAVLQELGVTSVTILGGPAAVDQAVADELAGLGVTVDRVAGANRWATAVEIARRLPERSPTAFIASGQGFADALAAVVPARTAGASLLLTARDVLPEETRLALEELAVERVIIAGGPAVVSEQVEEALRQGGAAVERVAGRTRYETAVALVEWAQAEGLQPSSVAVASGLDFPDALAGGAYAAMLDAPVLLSSPDSLERTGPPATWLDGEPLTGALVLGGRIALSTWIGHELQAIVDASAPESPPGG